MALRKIRLGDYIVRSTANNKDLKYGTELIRGVNNEGNIVTPKGDVNGVDLLPYKIVKNGAFVYNPSRLNIGSIARFDEELCIVSHLYIIFYLNDEGKKTIDPQWLYMYFRRKEFQREVDFRNFGSQRPEFSFDKMSDIEILLPDIDTQRKFVDVYLSMLENQKSYERGLEDLKLVCDGYIEDLRRKMPCEEIGPYIDERSEKNNDAKITNVLGISKEGFIDPRANMEGVSLTNYNVFYKDDFVYSPPRINVGSIGLYKGDVISICSPIYNVFYVNNTKKLMPDYLMMWFKRSEFLRSTDFYSIGSVRNNFDMDCIRDVKIPIPSIEIQQSIVNIFKCYLERKEINEKLKTQIKDICPILIKGSIEEAKGA